MKKYILFILLLLPIMLAAQPYYIGPSGSDVTGNGTRGNPYFTLTKAVSYCSPGDSVIALTGTYNYNSQQTVNVSGTAGNYIVITSEDVHPDSVIFDFWTYDVSGEAPKQIFGIYSIDDSYLKFEGITVKRLWKINTNNGQAYGFYMQNANHMIFDFCVVDSIAGRGFQCHNSADMFYYNCDAIWCADPQDDDPGNGGTGFVPTKSGSGIGTMEDTIMYQGCRAWQCADQGFSGGDMFIIYDGCWSFANGLAEYGFTFGGKHGFKLGYTWWDIDSIHTILQNSISAFNDNYGMTENTSSTGYKMNLRIYNNIIYSNGLDGIFTDSYTTNLDNVNKYVNNISYDNTRYDMYIFQSAVHYYNSFDSPYCPTCAVKYIESPASVSDADFGDMPANKAECVTVLGAARQEGGSLPDIGDYFHLTTGSDLIGIGIGLGLTYDGDGNYWNASPSIGAFEFDATPPEPPEYPEVTTVSVSAYNSFRATTGGGGIVTPEGTIAAKGVCWSTSINPTIANSKTNDGTGTDNYTSEITGLSSGTTYHIRAYVTDGAAQTSYGADVALTTPSVNYLQSGGKFLYDPATGKLLKR